MKKITILAALFFTASLMATPEFLKGGKVTVTLKNGKTYTYSSEEMAVVPRKNLQINSLKVEGFEIIHGKIIKDDLVENRKNRFYSLIGYGFDGSQEVSKSGDISSVKSKKGAILGAGYMRKLNNRFNLGLQIQTNGTAGFTVGADF